MPTEFMRATTADLAALQTYVVVALAFALDCRGVLSRFELADELEMIAGAITEGPVQELVEVLVAGLRVEAGPSALRVLDGGKA
jgi:hypothetical protein